MARKKSNLGQPMNVRLYIEHHERVKAISEASEGEKNDSDVLRELVAEAFAARDGKAKDDAALLARDTENHTDYLLHSRLERTLLNLTIEAQKSRDYLRQLTALSVLLRYTQLPPSLDAEYRQLCATLSSDASLSEIEEMCSLLLAERVECGNNQSSASDDVLGLDTLRSSFKTDDDS